jgi:hypothetical protein
MYKCKISVFRNFKLKIWHRDEVLSLLDQIIPIICFKSTYADDVIITIENLKDIILKWEKEIVPVGCIRYFLDMKYYLENKLEDLLWYAICKSTPTSEMVSISKTLDYINDKLYQIKEK